ncbi:MAG TPA: MFS transporter [Vicinamibacterales bacterium]|nr:MFS transporter [Vicinamibacterales bacterium]
MDLTPLRHRDFRLLFIAQFVSILGTMITYVALPYQMYRMTGSSLSVGLLGVAELVPLLATAFIGGALADAVDRRRMAIVTDIGLAAGSVTLAIAATAGSGAPLLYAVAAWMAGVGALQRPSVDSLLPRLVEKHEIPAAAALGMFRGSVGMIAGPAIGGVLIAAIGLGPTYLVDVASYLVSLACLWSIRPVPPVESAERPSVAAVLDGFRYAISRQELIGTYVVDFIAMVFGMPLALFPALADRLGGASVLGLVYAAPAIGALAASLTSQWTARVYRQGRAVVYAATMWGMAIVAFGLCTTLWPALAWLAVAGAADAVSGIFRLTLWNQTIPDELRGRLASIEMVSYSSGPLLGHLEAGVVAAMFSVRASVISGGVLCVIGVLACGWWLPRFVRYDARQSASALTSP